MFVIGGRWRHHDAAPWRRVVRAPGSLAERKRDLRRAVLARRDALPEATRIAASGTIFITIAALDAFRGAETVLAYHSFGSEPVTAAFLQAVLAGGKALVLPRVRREGGRLDLYRVLDPDAQLEPGVWGIREPDPAVCAPVAPSDVDFVLVPGVAFDARGGRIGYGGGYYDRLLAEVSEGTALVAAAFAVQLVEEVPMEPGDRQVDVVVTERRTYPA